MRQHPDSPCSKQRHGYTAMRELDITRLLLTIHEGPFEEPHWSTFLEALRAVIKADYVSLAFRRPSPAIDETSVLHAGRSGTGHRTDTIKQLYHEPRSLYENLTIGVVHNINNIVDKGDSAYADYRNYLKFRGLNFNRVLRIKESGSANVWLAVNRCLTDFSTEEEGLLSRVAPHVATAVRNLILLERDRIRTEITSDAVRRLNFSWFTLDASGSVVELESEAANLFRRLFGPCKVSVGRPFHAPTPAAQISLREALDAFNSPIAAPRAIHLLDDPWLDMLVVPLRTRSISREVNPIAVVYVHGSAATNLDRCEQLIDLFTLNRSEARLALLLSQGKGIPNAAREMGLTLETARNYSKRIYAKTATRGQADLVRLIMASVVALT
jgi:DNA-binding CsgD family transcriptional regulator